jgi:hypothetical protein
LEGEAAEGRVDLVGGEAEVGEDEIGFEVGFEEASRGVGEVAVEGDDLRGGISGFDCGGCEGEVGGVGVVEDDGSGLQERGESGGVAAEAGGAVQAGVVGLGGEGGEDFGEEDGGVGGHGARVQDHET